MRYRINHAGNRIVEATPAETHALTPCICAALRRWHCPESNVEEFAQDVELITWQALAEQRVMGDRFARPRDALLAFMFAVAWNQWRNHSRRRTTRYEELHDEIPDVVGPEPDPRLEAREALERISMHEDIAWILATVLRGERPEHLVGLPRSTFYTRVAEARRHARDVAAGKPHMPDPPTPKHRKGKR
jgi:DNA-directed RNA polymerase specialized sigma24 family protein